ncbi:receptor-like protein 2 [Pistacia vera]|uniref:receptor-like protein 2 n=1 Tax=Pistacia vera TaxID=55513 RepID=UPI001262B868|nr:receptor-like protein 2 [Pistacia vera]
MKNCINLIKLNLRNNKLEGDLSAFNFSMFRHLRTIDLGSNNFTGSFPSTLYSCKSLTAVRLSRNNIEGEISPEIVALESLSYLSLAQNRLTNATAAIKILTGCKNLSVLFLCKNFKGEMIPDDITFSYAFPNLQVLALSKSQFQGQVPSWISNLRKLQFLDLSLNQITGSIPRWLGTMTSLFYIDLSYNLLSGEFPKELGGLPMLVSELQAAKKIGGSRLELPLFVPPNINASNEEYYSLLSLPPSIFLQNNSLSGSIPIEIGQLQFLQLLNLSNNKFFGNIPDQISKLTNLERLDLSGNNLSGEIPASLSGLYFLSEFSVANNNLHGLIPSGGQFHTFSIPNFEGNPGLCGDIIEISCSIRTRTNNNPVPSPSESSKKELVYGLTAGVVFGFIIGSVGGIFYPIRVYSLFRTL